MKKIKAAAPLFSIITFLMISLFCKAQTSTDISGTYKLGTSLLSIYDDHTFIIADVNVLVFGVVEASGSSLLLKEYMPKQKFVLYGRKESANKLGNTIMFSGFDEGDALVNTFEKKCLCHYHAKSV